MKVRSSLIFLAFPFCLLQCRFVSDQIKDSFDTVNNSLVKSNKSLGNTINTMYASIDSNRKQNRMLAQKADSIYQIVEKADIFIDSLKQFLHDKDTAGTNIKLAESVIINAVNGDILKAQILNVAAQTASAISDSNNRKSLDSILHATREIFANPDWKENYFKSSPTMAASTMLTKFQNDCKNAGLIALKDINERIRK